MPYTADQFSNFASTLLAGGGGGTGTPLYASDTTLSVSLGDGNAKLPSKPPFMLLLGASTNGLHEIAKCTLRVGDTLTIVRGQEGTTAQAVWPVNTPIQQIVTAGNLSNLWTHVKSLSYHVDDFGAVGDGVTDDSVAISAAYSAASTGGGTVRFGPKTYISGAQTLYNFVHTRGEGIGATIIKLKNGANSDLFWGGSANAALINLSAAAQSGPASGGAVVGNFGFYDLTLDGNRANQTGGPSYPLRIYGFGYILSNVRIRQGYSGGVLSDWNGSGSGPNTYDSMESQWSNVKIHDCGGVGLEIGGPHDSIFSNVVIYYTDGHALHVAPNANSLVFSELHCWTTNPNNNAGVTSVGMLIESQSCHFVGCQSESCQAVEVVLLAGGHTWVGGRVFGGNARLSVYGFQLGQANGATAYANQILSTTSPAAVQDIFIATSFSECQSGAAEFVNESNNALMLHIQQSTGTVLGGTPSATDRLMIDPRGVSASGTAATSGLNRMTSGSNEAWAFYTPAGLQMFNVDMHSSPAVWNLVNNAMLHLYSDSYATRQFSLNDDGHGSIVSAGTLTTGPNSTPTSGSPNIGSGSSDSSPWTLNVANVGMFRTLPQANCTSVALQAGLHVGQQVVVTNESSTYTITFSTAANSRVADGTSDVIAANTARTFVWNGTNWMKMA